ncbi:PIN-like domain-containing protein [Micromonospora fluostatini]|uniref:PIN-like domain-containing protein n=1 Tax=Micromonospora sp. JCM 30529 TaxID=3421643 RepID=UPI003D1845D9
MSDQAQHAEAAGPLGGIFDGFEAYRRIESADLERAVRSSVVALDTNVLLDLYRVLKATRDDNLKALWKIADRLFMPAQVQREFWRNRDQVILDVIARDSAKELQQAQQTARLALGAWGRQSMSQAEATVLQGELDSAFKEVRKKLQAGGEGLKLNAALKDVELDPVLKDLGGIFAGRVGHPFSDERLTELVAEGRRRFARLIPPGYLDAEKANQVEEGTGDFLLWEQLIAYARVDGRDILFVTRDVKADWWRLGQLGAPLGPRPELVDEMWDRAGVRLLLAEPAQLWEALLEAYPDLPINQSTVDDTERLSEDADVEGSTPWTMGMWETLLSRLEDSAYPKRVAVLRAAARDPEGFIPREQVYKICGYDPAKRLLVGFTRPVIGATRELVASGELPAGLEPALRAHYLRPGKAEGFLVPRSVVEIHTDQIRGVSTES